MKQFSGVASDFEGADGASKSGGYADQLMLLHVQKQQQFVWIQFNNEVSYDLSVGVFC